VRNLFKSAGKPVDFVLVKPENLQAFIATNQSRYLQQAAVTCCPKSMSCRSGSWGLRANLWGLLVVISVTIFLVINPLIVLVALLSFVFIALILLMGFRLACLRSLQKPCHPDVEQKLKITPLKRPKVSILVPLFHESAILQRLIARLQALAYPKELLEICFIYEEKDLQTKAALQNMTLPIHMKFIEVPSGKVQTKPRAMNYALDFCSGSIIGIYDAEDAPEINQIERVVEKFAASDENVGCIQCILDFYNTSTNWMSRCFTVEYAILFRLILPALDRMKLPIPLGGTSVFFRREILEKLGRWDAYNVTEDADLGYRLYQMGYRCSWINAVTYEEANYRLIPWIKQRSRWLKGFFMTALLHFKNPVKLQKKIGTPAVLTMLALTVVPWILCPMAPIILPMWALSFGIDLPYYSNLPIWFINTLVITFIATEMMSLYLAYRITKTDQHQHLRVWLLTTIFYWPIAFLASYKALFEVIFRPAYWDKSEHGVNDHLYTVKITELTRNQGIKG
jgi:cellulose synthase/poly-beta-1,6-N-acetylglucosamine synthase-like glycosyltransferase